VSLAISHSLMLRIGSALVLAPVVLFALIYGGLPFQIMLGVALLICFYEWLRMARLSKSPILISLFGIVYIAVGFAAFYYLRMIPPLGLGLALSLLLSIWASDIGAYFSGKTFGGPKLAPAISPNKTWAGLIGGMLSSTIMMVAYALYVGDMLSTPSFDLHFPNGIDIVLLAVLGASVTISGQIGDLIESALKRSVGFKDSSNLIPGHGGLLDRIDSLILAAPVFLLCLKVLGL
jgi:phosphatidate cytidylyltransferase